MRATKALPDRVFPRLDMSDPTACWLWPGNKDRHGYGYVERHRRCIFVHRIAYEHVKGPIPAGFAIDHLCRTRLCCNPDHLEAVTPAENSRRACHVKRSSPYGGTCGRGHAYDEANTYVMPDGRRACRACAAAASRRYQARKRALREGKSA